MTDAEIEQIARLYCRKLGLDPDEMTVFAFDTYKWDVAQTLAMSEAIAEVRATVTEGGV